MKGINDKLLNENLFFNNIILFDRSAKGIINLWSLKTKRTELTLDGHDGHAILAADFLPSGTVIRSADKCLMKDT